MQEFGYTQVIMNQRTLNPFGTEADKVDNSYRLFKISILKLQLVAKASPVFHKDTIIWKSIRFNIGVYLRPMMKRCILNL
jgi:hypothetical protein